MGGGGWEESAARENDISHPSELQVRRAFSHRHLATKRPMRTLTHFSVLPGRRRQEQVDVKLKRKLWIFARERFPPLVNFK